LNFFTAVPALRSAPFDDAFQRSKSLNLETFIWQNESFTTEAAPTAPSDEAGALPK
jgi:hypothetical protein